METKALQTKLDLILSRIEKLRKFDDGGWVDDKEKQRGLVKLLDMLYDATYDEL